MLVQSSNRSARIMSIFQETQNSKVSENSDNKTGDYSSFKITKIYFQKKSSQNTCLQFHNCWLSRVLDIQNHTFFHWFWMEKKCWFVSLWVLFVLRFINDNVFIKGLGVSLPTSVSSISIQCMVDEIRLTVLTTWKLIRRDPWMSESLENDRWSSGSVDYSFPINWGGNKQLTIVNFTLCRNLRLTHLSSTIFEDRLPPYVLTVVNQFHVILTKKRCCLSFCG